jgi:hypothetical protein
VAQKMWRQQAREQELLQVQVDEQSEHQQSKLL